MDEFGIMYTESIKRLALNEDIETFIFIKNRESPTWIVDETHTVGVALMSHYHFGRCDIKGTLISIFEQPH